MTSSTDSAKYSTEFFENVLERLKQESLQDSTKATYYKVWLLFNKFYIKLDVKPPRWENKIALFGAYLVQKKRKPATLKSYYSAITSVLQNNGIVVSHDRLLLSTLVKACRLNNNKVYTRLSIRLKLFKAILDDIYKHYNDIGQPYLAMLYRAMVAMAYHGLMRVGELTDSPHNILAETYTQVATNTGSE